MKTLAILILVFLLGAAAAATRPKEADFREIVKAQVAQRQKNANFFDKLFSRGVDGEMKRFTFTDRFLYIEVEKEGQTVGYGAFSHWFVGDVLVAKS